YHQHLHSFPTHALPILRALVALGTIGCSSIERAHNAGGKTMTRRGMGRKFALGVLAVAMLAGPFVSSVAQAGLRYTGPVYVYTRSEEHTSELQSLAYLV